MWSPSQSIGSFFGFNSNISKDNTTERQLQDVLEDLNKSANMLVGDGDFKVNWTNGTNPFDNNSFAVSPNSLVDRYKQCLTGHNYYNALDALHGRVIIGAQIRKNVTEEQYNLFEHSEDVVKRTFQTWQEGKAVEAINADWPGFQPYLERHAKATRLPKHRATAYCSSEAKSDALQNIVFNANYNYLNPSDPITHGTVVDDLINQFNDQLDGSVESIKDALSWLKSQLKEVESQEQQQDQSDDSKGEGDDDGQGSESPEGEDGENQEQDSDAQMNDPKGKESMKQSMPHVSDQEILGQTVETRMPNLGDDEHEDEGDCFLDDMVVHTWSMDDIATKFRVADNTANVSLAESTYKAIVRSGSNHIKQIAKVFQFEDNVPHLLSYGASAGDLDDCSFHKIRMGDFDRIYQVKDAPKQDDHLIGLLLDQSGSMRDKRIAEARKVLIYLLEGIKTYKTLKTVVMGHTAQYESFYERKRRNTNTLDMIPYITPNGGDNRQLLAVAPAIANNVDGSAIGEIGKVMLTVQNVTKKFLIHISDGEPSAEGYNQGMAYKHTKQNVDKLMKQGIKVFGIGIESAFSDSVGRKLYGDGNFIVLKDTASSLSVMVKKLKSFLLK